MISFIIVSYNSGETIFSSIKSIINSCDEPYEIIVVDNRSPDISYLEKLRALDGILLIENSINLGFSKANNIGFKHSAGNIIFYINPDVIVTKDNLKNILLNVSDSNVVSSSLVDRNGNLQKSKYLIPFISNYFSYIINGNYIEWVHGALLVMTRANVDIINGWSEDYFMYAEDIDICIKINKKNIDLVVLDEKVTHYGGTSTSTVWSNLERAIIIEKSNYILYRKFNKRVDYYLISLLNLLRFALRDRKMFLNKLKSFYIVVKHG